MINIRELRIDNWVRIMEPDKYAGAVGKIQTLASLEGSYFTINVNDSNSGYLHTDVFCEDLEPIPLTAEILKGNNFRRYDMDYQIADDLFISFHKSKEGFSLFTQDCLENNVHLRYITYVHQLQNILIDLGIDKEIIL